MYRSTPTSGRWRAVLHLSTLLLGLSWLAFGVAKALGGQPGVALQSVFPHPLDGVAGYTIALAEVGLGLVLLFGRPALGRPALAVSFVLLVTYGVWALWLRPVRCTCAGRLFDLTPAYHSMLTGAMLVLVGIAARVGPSGPTSRAAWQVRAGLAVCVLALVIALGGPESAATGHIPAVAERPSSDSGQPVLATTHLASREEEQTAQSRRGPTQLPTSASRDA